RNKFDSMLPDDTKQRRQAALDQSVKTLQSSLTDHFKPKDKRPIPYSDKAFACAAIEWLIDGDLPLQVFNRPSFQKMIDIASRATRGVKIPSTWRTCGHIIKTFKQQMCLLKERLNVSSFLSPFVPCANAHAHSLEPCCERRNQPDMRRMASR
ncbi:hypothetical protein EDB83DRAFT_2217123, partial [Lactarius deliciosus]